MKKRKYALSIEPLLAKEGKKLAKQIRSTNPNLTITLIDFDAGTQETLYKGKKGKEEG